MLEHLGIQYVSISCHSGGTIYALDMVLKHPEILHPERPYLAIAGPWILPSHTNSMLLSIVQSLPASVIGRTDKLASLLVKRIGPVLGVCFGASQALVAKITPASSTQESEDVAREGAEFEEEIWPKIIESVYAEGVQGVSSDAVLFMRKANGTAGWSDWGDYDVLVPRLAEHLRTAGKRLSVDVFYAESDYMIGDGGSKGPKWFDKCWDSQNCGDVIDYRATTVKGADHDGIWNLKWGAVQEVFERIGQPVEESSSSAAE